MSATPHYHVLIRLLNCHNLPKADVVGKIDPYVKFCFNNAETLKSSTKKVDYDPIYNERLGASVPYALGTDVFVEVWDHDAVGKDDKVGWASFKLEKGHRQYKDVELVLKKGMKGHNGTPTISFEVMTLLSPDGLDHIPGAIVTGFQSKKSIIAPLPGYETTALVEIEYEQGRVDIKAYSLVQNKYVSLGYSLPNFEYKIRFERAVKRVASYTVYTEAKLDDIPADFQLNLVKIYIGDANIKSKTNLEEISAAHGWVGSLTYKDAKRTLKNVYCDDSSETVYMFGEQFAAKFDWDSKNVDFAAYLFQSAQQKNLVAEMTAKGKTKQTHTYFAQPKQMNGQLLTMKSSVDDIKYGTLNEDIIVELYEVTNVKSVTFTDVFPVYN